MISCPLTQRRRLDGRLPAAVRGRRANGRQERRDHRARARRTHGACARMASRRASRSGWACNWRTSPSGTPTGRTPAIPACPRNCSGPCRRACWPATSPGRCPRRSRSARWPTTATKARCCCRCRSPSRRTSSLRCWAATWRSSSRPVGWSASKECIPEEGEFALKIPARSTTALNAPAFQAAFDAQPKPLAGESQAQIEGNALKLSVAGLPARAARQDAGVLPGNRRSDRNRGAVDAGLARRHLDGASAGLAAAQPEPRGHAGRAGRPARRAGAPRPRSWANGRPSRRAAGVSPALEAALRGNAARAAPAPSLTLARRAAGRPARRPSAEPDALRVPDPRDQGGGLHAPRRRPSRPSPQPGWPTPPAWWSRSRRWAR